MADIDEIIDYLKTLRKGFDKDLFQNKIDHLTYVVETSGLDYEDFNTLFKIWLNLSISITKWTSLGLCLVPRGIVEERTVDYVFRWILANKEDQTNFSRVAFLLDWLTAAMESNSIDMEALDTGYEIFYNMLTYETLTVHAIKLVYTLTKPADVTRRRVLELLDYAKKREVKKSWYRQLQVLLGLFKSYKPECVPEDVPAISIHSAFKKINVNMLERFKKCQDGRNNASNACHLLWINPVNSMGSINKNAVPLVPNMEFLKIGSHQYTDSKSKKTYFDFSDPASLIRNFLHNSISRPAKLRALLCNETGITLLAVASQEEHSFFSHDLYHVLNHNFLETSSYSYIEKQDFLRRLALLQRTLLQGIPVITRFLAQFIPLWNERDYFQEILELVEWISVDCPDQILYIVEPLTKIYHRAQPLEQCVILRSLTNMYCNLVYASSRPQQYFMGMNTSRENYSTVLQKLATDISVMCDRELQVNPDDMRVLYTSVWSAENRIEVEINSGYMLGTLPGKLTLAMPLICISVDLVDKMAGLIFLYRKNLKKNKSQNNLSYEQQKQILERYVCDMRNCLFEDGAISRLDEGIIFNNMNPALVANLTKRIPDIDSKFSLVNNLSFAPTTFAGLDEGIDYRKVDKKMWFSSVLDQEYRNLTIFLKNLVRE